MTSSESHEAVHTWKDAGGRPGLELRTATSRVRLTLTGAHIQSWYQEGVGELFFLSREADYGPGVASRGGVPIVFPWFGGREGLPAHGFARTLDWQVVKTCAGPSVTLRLQDDETTRAHWPHAFRADLTVTLGAALTVRFEVTNTGDQPWEFEEALHTYFRVGDVHRARVHGFESVPFVEHARAPQAGTDPAAPITFEAETDRVFQGVPDLSRLQAPALGHTFEIRTQGARSAVVWNPWTAKAAGMSQMAEGEWTEFVCVESANCKAEAIQLQPGASHALEVTWSTQTE